jgi:hypothetical protein
MLQGKDDEIRKLTATINQLNLDLKNAQNDRDNALKNQKIELNSVH